MLKWVRNWRREYGKEKKRNWGFERDWERKWN
jgi:hypothetical protein